MSAPRLLMLYVRHGREKYSHALAELQDLCQRRLPGVPVVTLVIDNALPAHHHGVEDGVEVIGGDNDSWEFSAWTCGLSHLGERVDAFDVVGLVTSAFGQLEPHHLERLSPAMLSVLAGRGRVLGHIDYRNEPARLLGVASQCWIRTSFLLLPPRELRLLGDLATITDETILFTGDAASPFRVDAPVSTGLREGIVSWLCGDGLGQGTTWHSRFRLSADTLPFFQKKAMAILNEQALTSRLVAQGCSLVDMTWLGGCLEEGRGVPGALPGWRAQLTHRDVRPVSPTPLGL